jgi:hypothetical protein
MGRLWLLLRLVEAMEQKREREKQSPLFSSQRPRQHGRCLAIMIIVCGYIGMGTLWLVLEVDWNSG